MTKYRLNVSNHIIDMLSEALQQIDDLEIIKTKKKGKHYAFLTFLCPEESYYKAVTIASDLHEHYAV